MASQTETKTTIRISNFRAIQTRYIGPTNTRGARVKVTDTEKPWNSSLKPMSLTISWVDSLSSEENHAFAAKAFLRKYEWTGEWVGASAERGYVFTNTSSSHSINV